MQCKLFTVVMIAALGVAGCGKEDQDASDEAEVKRVAQAYVDALVAGDAAAACEALGDSGGRCVEATKEDLKQGKAFGQDFGLVEQVRLEEDVARANFSTGAFLVLSRSGDSWQVGAPQGEAADLGAPKAPETERCSAQEEKKLREQSQEAGIPIDEGPLYCQKETTTDK